MKPLKWTVIGLAIGLALFTFIPTQHSADEVTKGFMATTVSRGNVVYDPFQLLAEYDDEGSNVENTDPEDNDLHKALSGVEGALGYIFCDKSGTGIECTLSSGLSGNRMGSPHKGVDLVPVGGLSAYGINEVFAVCPFAGTVVGAGYDLSVKSAGYCVTVQLSEHVFIQYMHLGYGAGKAVQYPNYTTPEALVKSNPNQAVGYPDEWVTEQDWAKARGKSGYAVSPLRWVGPSSIQVKVGDKIEAGAVIGVPGDTGNSTGIHSHFTLYYKSGGTRYFTDMYEVLCGKNAKDLKWYKESGWVEGTAQSWDLDLSEVNIQVTKGGSNT